MSDRVFFTERLMIAVLDEGFAGRRCGGGGCTKVKTGCSPKTLKRPCVRQGFHEEEPPIDKARMFDLVNLITDDFNDLDTQIRAAQASDSEMLSASEIEADQKALEQLEALDEMLKAAREELKDRLEKLK